MIVFTFFPDGIGIERIEMDVLGRLVGARGNRRRDEEEVGRGMGLDGFLTDKKITVNRNMFERFKYETYEKIKSFTPERTNIYESRWDPSK